MSRKLWLAATGVLLTVVSLARADEDLAARSLAAGDQALAKFQLEHAIAAYRTALKAAPDNYEANWKLARGLADQAMLASDRARQKELYLEAMELARAAVRLNPRDSKGHTFLAIVLGKLALFQGGRQKVELSKEVKAEAEKAVALDPNEDLAYHVLGVWNREMVELNWMLKKFAEVLYGRFPPASMDEALRDLRKASALAPNVVPHQVELGVTLAAARQWEEAKTTLDHALAMPKSWVTDDVYKEQAKQTRARVAAHLK